MEQNPFDQFDATASTSAANPFDQFDEVKKSSVARRALGDTGISLLKGAIAVPEAAVGLADIATGGRAGKVAEGLGFRPKEAKEMLNEYYSPEQKAANQKLSEAEGFVDNVKTAVQNPSTILQAGVESVPLIAGGGVVGLGARALKATPVIAGAIGEGAVGAGMAAEGIRQEADDGLLSAKQSGIAALSGVGTAAFGAAGGKLANKLGIGDIDTIAAGGASPTTNKGFARKLVEGGIAEGVFEELPQSVQEQMLSNYALDKPLTEGVDKAAAMGLLTGSAMGAGVGALTGGKDKLVIDQSGLEADAALAEQKQAEYDAQQPAQTEQDEFTNFTQQVDADIEQRKIAAGIKKPAEAIPASDILGDENVSDTTNAATSMAAEATQPTGDNTQGSAADLPIQPNVSGVGDVAVAPASSEPGNVATGTGSNGNDTLSRPFAQAADDFLPKMRGMTTDAKVIGQIDEELKLRGITNVDSVNTPAERVDETAKGVHVGEKINKEWTAFSPESGTLNIPRSEMPQVKAEHRGAMVNFLNARGVDHTQETVPASSLKPTQQEFSEAKVKKASKYAGGDRSILVSSDNHVLDGHHQWLSKLNKGGDVDVIRLNAPITQLLDDVKEFPSSTVESGATTSKVQKPKSPKQYKPKTLLATLRDLGGIALTEKQDVTGEVKGFAPGGYNQVFKSNTTRSLKGLIESGDLDDYLPYGMRLEANGANDEAFDSTEAYDYLADKIRNGESVLPYDAEQEIAASKYYDNQDIQNDIDVLAEELDLVTINALLQEAGHDERESTTEAAIYESEGSASKAENTEQASADGGIGSGERETATTAINARKQAQVDNKSANKTASIKDAGQAQPLLSDSKDNNSDLLGDNTTAKQAIADAERAKDAKRNSGADNQDTFTLTGSNSEADQAAAAGAQDLFDAPSEKLAPGTRINGEVEKSAADRLEQLLEEINKTNDAKFYSRGEPLTNAKNQIQNAVEELRKAKTVSSIEGMLAQSSSALSKNYAALADVVDQVIESLEGKAARTETKPADTQKAKDDARFANNKIFTADKVAAARARLKSKLNTLNSGIDPELMMDGITIAGAYLETGVRKFSDYAKAMTEDFGDSIKPYLLSFYEAARAYPGIDKEGMTDQETAEAEHQALLTPAVLEQAKEVIGQGVVSTPKAKAKPNGQIKLTQDWGVDSIDGWTESKDGKNRETDYGLQGGVKDQFLAEGKKYLTQVSKLLEAEGWEAHKDKRGRTQKPISVNESGVATSGEVSLTMRKGNVGVYVDLGTSAIRGLTGNHPQGVSLMIRATDSADTDQYATKGQNIWLSTDLSSTELANKLMQTAERYVKNTEQAEEGSQNARLNQTEQVHARGTKSDLLTEQPRDSNSKQVDAGLGRASESADAGRNISSGVPETSRSGATSASGSNRNESPSGSREAGNARDTASAANGVNDFEITDETGVGEGGLAQKYKDNITAIKLIKTLESENRIATPEERNQLAKYNGFGALSKVFEKGNPKYQELKDLLTPEEYESARASILNAYYTSPTIVKAMYDAVAHMGFKGGRILEPSLGSGNFFGMMPAAMRNKSKLNGVELDVITSRLAKYLYPNANIAVATGFEKYQAPQGYFDLVISNPPFGSEQLRDSEKADYSGFSIHNFFIAKSIDKLRDDGILAVVVSHNFMDAMDTKAREWISKRAILRGAVRLPRTAFKDNAGTEVITDILFFQKTNTPEQNPDWVNATNEGDYSFNDYFYRNPRSVLGRITDTTSQFGKTFTIEPISENGTLAQQLKEFTNSLMANVYVEPEKRIEVMYSADSTVPDGVKVGTFYTDEKGTVRQRMPDLLGAKRSSAWEAPNAKAQERMLGMMGLRDLLRNQMRLERDPMATAKEIEANRKKLNTKYDAFLKEFGYLNSMTNRRLFLDDTESALVQALEMDYDAGVTKTKALTTGMEEKPASAQKADIFSRRVLFPPSDSITVNNAKDALLASLNVKGVVDADYMAEVYGKDKEAVIAELGEVVYDDPLKGYVTADEYLSGDVKTKLAEAKAKAKEDSKFTRNVEALEKVIPKDKLPSEIYASAGANWIPADVYADFAAEITGIPKDSVEYKYVPAAAMWLSEKTRGGDAGKMTSDFGTPDVNAFDLFHLLINGKAPEVREMIGYGSDRKSVVNIEKTEAARSKLDKIKETWNSWVFKDATRADRLATIYNDKHNRTVSRKFDGSHMQFYGMSPAVTLRAHQKDVVWRAIQDRNVLLDHVVGAGKTMAMASIAMEMKRLGIARKPMFVVPNHLTLQWRSEFTKLYPASNILAATPDDFAKDKREKLFSKMVTGNYDAIIIGHSSLTKVGLPALVEEKMYQEQVKELSDAIEAAKTERGDRGITRDMEKIKKNLEAKIDKLKEKAGAKDNVVSFDELGIDALFVDEMHEFKNLFFTTQMQRTAGLGNPAGSGKALDLFMKIKFMTETYGEDVPLITATGTPVSNSLAEMFTMQRYMKYPQMKRQDLHLFDAWAKQFGEVENVYEVAPSGVGYRQSTRFSKFKNLPALMGSYTSFADIITMQDLKDQTAAQIDPQTGKPKVFPVPKLRSGKPINVIAQRSDLQRDFFGVPQLAVNEKTGAIEFELDPGNAIIEQNKEGKYQVIAIVKDENGDAIGRSSIGNSFDTKEDAELELVTKALTPKTFIDPKSLLGQFANLAQLTRESKGKINALSLTGLANKSGLDYRIIDPSAPDFAGSKINQAVTNMVDLWKETTKDKGTQIVFCDLSIPNSARNDMGSKERRIYVRDRDGELTHKAKGVVYAPEGYEGFPFYITKGRNGFDVYEAVTGTMVRDYGLQDKAAAKAWIASYVESESSRDRIFALRDTKTIDQSDIDEYRDAKELELADDGSNEISTADMEAVAGSSKFSVYDDIRSKLMKAGVPENQIAFIHDYNTPKQKEELFKRVNAGDVRFLFGSTPKLGAGTNVQKRLVGLHHIDAPWRPSDLEQREGRIIRQGNELYARDPENFEIAIWRYATEQTYDTRRWQLLEHKAAGIEQLRKYTGESEIEDVASEAANSADMKAAASGNPLILEETKLRTEVKRLVNLEKAHADAQYAMARKVRDNKHYINEYLPGKIAEYERMQDLSKAHPIPSDKDKVATMKVDGKVVTSREAAESAIADLALKTRSSFTMGETPKLIQYRGVEFTVNRGMGLNTLMLRSPDGLMHTYGEKEGVSPSGLITRFNNYIDSFAARIEDANNAIGKANIENESLSARLNEPFEQSDVLKQTQAEHANVQRRLMKSSQLESVPEEQRPEFDRLVKARKETLKKLGLDKALKESESDAPMFTRGAGGKAGLSKEAIQGAVNSLRKSWKNAPEIIVVQDMSDPAIREAVREENDRQLSQGAEGQPEGFFDAGKVYIVASEMNSPDDVIRVVFHETLGHYGLRGLYGKELGGILDRVAMLRKREMVKKAKQYGLDLNNQGDVRVIAEEVLAEMAQTAPGAGFVQRAIAAIRQFLRDIGVNLKLTDNDIIANYLLPARNFVVNGQNKDGVMGMVAAFVRNNREPSKADGDTFLTAALEFTARNEEFFENAPSDSKEIADIAKDMNTQFRVEPFGKSQTKLDGADTAWEVFLPNTKYRSAVIYEKDNEVWINVSRLRSGADVGNRIYSLAAAYAYNNDKVFIGDPLGLTAKAFYRRAENMLSSALKYGTTQHIEPHVAQTDPDLYYSFDEKTKDFGEAVRKINWKKGNDAHNIKELIYTVYHGAISNLPELKNVIFNPTTQGFTTIAGEQFTDDDFERVLSDYYARTDGDSGSRIVDGSSQDATVNTAETSNPYRAGIRTAKRAAFYNTFLRQQGSEVRAELLGSYVRELQNRGLAPALRGVMYSRSNPQSSLTPQWDAPAESKLDNVVYALQDKNVDLKRVSQAIKKAGTDIADRWNAYLQEELYHGRTAKRTQDFIKNDLEPLIEDMRMRGVGMADFEEYLWARHAEERNIQIAKINPKMPDSGSGMSTQDARDYLAKLSPTNKTKYEALARRIDLINRKSRQVLVDYGLESTSTIASWESAYKNYVPLMREDMDAGFGNGTGQGFSVKGNSAKRATGSNRAVVDIIANMAQQYEKNVIRGEKNRVSTALIGLAKLNPNADFWEVDTPPSTKTIVKGKTVYEVLYNGSKVQEFSNKPAASNFIQWNGSAGYTINEVKSPEQVEYVTDPNYKNRDNVIVARIVNKLGKVEERSVVFNQFDERAMRMAASLKNLDQDQIGELLGAASGITRYFASVNTQYNPIFGLINITRDVQGALLNLNTTPIANKKKEVLGHTLDALKGIYQDLRSERKNGTTTGNKWSQLFEEFQNEGGQTGYRDMFRNAKERGEALKNALDPTWWQNSKIGKVISLNGAIANQEQWIFDKAIKPIFDWLSDYNNALENAVRLSVYKVALDNGHSKQQAASMAKNISVNFNRKGEMGRQIGSLYAFFNASVQGTARIGETLTSTDTNGKIKLSTIGKRIVQGGLLLGAMQALLLAAAGYDDDEPPEFVRDRSLIIPLDFFGADGKFVTIPMPLGYNAIPAFSRILTEWALSGGENTQERLVHILDMVMNVTNPIGNAGLSLQTIAPTVIDPLAALAENKDFTGRPIAREDFNSLNPTPGFTRAKDTASAISKGLAYGINAITGGTDYKPGEFSPSPDQIDYLIGQVTGGVGREAMKVEQTATALVTGEDLPAYKIPIVGRFYGDATGQSSQGNAFYKNLREINKHENQIKGMIKAGEDPTQYRLDNPESRLITQANYTERAVQKLRKQRRGMLEKGSDPSAIESIDERITELMLNLNEKVKLRKEMQ